MSRERHDQIALFHFTLSPHQSIGPAQLQALWARACERPDVGVGRAHSASPKQPTYSLYASQRLENLPQVERRLRELLEACQLRASLVSLHPA